MSKYISILLENQEILKFKVFLFIKKKELSNIDFSENNGKSIIRRIINKQCDKEFHDLNRCD